MTQKLFAFGVTIAAVTLAAALVSAQDTTTQGQAGDPPVVQGTAPPAQGQMGPGRGRRLGQGQGQGLGPGQGLGQQLGPRAGRGGQMIDRRRGAGPAAPGVGRGRGAGLAALGLTEDQRVTIVELQRGVRDQIAPLQDELEFTRKTLHRELFADERDDAKIAKLSAAVAGLEKQLADVHLKAATSMADVLTAKQRETMRLREGRGRGRVAGRGPGGGGMAGR